MLNLDRNTQQQAWGIAGDPSASEEKWMAAVTLLDGKNPLVAVNPRPPGWVAMPWALVVSGASASGAVLLFSLVQLILCTKIAETFASASAASNVAVAFGVWFVPCLVFSMLFTYKRLLYEGGNAWKFTQWTLVIGYLASISFWAIDGQAIEPWDAGLLAVWNISCVSIAAIGTKLAEHCYKSLNQTIGAQRVVVPMMRSFAVIPVVIAAIVLTGMSTGYYMPFSQVFLLLASVVVGASYLTVKQLSATRSSTACSITTVLWGPFILSNLLLLPALAVTHAWLSFTGPYFINWVDYAGALAALGVSVMAPMAGGWIASKQLQARAALTLERGDQRQALGTTSDTNITSLSSNSAQM